MLPPGISRYEKAAIMPAKRSLAVAALSVYNIVAVAGQNINVGRLLRFSCSQLVIERTDPLVNPGLNPSPHTHQIVGGNSFNVTVRFARPFTAGM